MRSFCCLFLLEGWLDFLKPQIDVFMNTDEQIVLNERNVGAAIGDAIILKTKQTQVRVKSEKQDIKSQFSS